MVLINGADGIGTGWSPWELKGGGLMDGGRSSRNATRAVSVPLHAQGHRDVIHVATCH